MPFPYPEGVDELITCIDCGGRCHLLTTWDPAEPLEVPGPGDVVVYRCEDCLDRWDIVVPEAEQDGA